MTGIPVINELNSKECKVADSKLLSKHYEMRGTRYYKARITYDRGDLVNNSPLKLAHQPNNKHDSDAIAIYLCKTGEMIGHIPREHAPLIRKLLELGRIVSISAKHLHPSGEHLYLDCDISITSSLKQTPAWIKSLSVQNVPGVYAITCTATGYTYIGESEHVRSRIQEHFEQLDLLSHHNIPLQECHDLYGNEDAWNFEVLEVIEDENKRKIRETEILQEHLNSGEDLFNRTPDGKGISSHHRKQKPQISIDTSSYSDRKKLQDWLDELENERYNANQSAPVSVPPRKVGCLSVFLCVFILLVMLWKN